MSLLLKHTCVPVFDVELLGAISQVVAMTSHSQYQYVVNRLGYKIVTTRIVTMCWLVTSFLNGRPLHMFMESRCKSVALTKRSLGSLSECERHATPLDIPEYSCSKLANYISNVILLSTVKETVPY